jgi:hypothetical protein
MPELIVYDKRNKRLQVNSAVRYHGNRAIVIALLSTERVKIKTGGIISEVPASKVEVL